MPHKKQLDVDTVVSQLQLNPEHYEQWKTELLKSEPRYIAVPSDRNDLIKGLEAAITIIPLPQEDH